MEQTPNPLPHLPRPTKSYHRTVYDRIRPNRPDLSLKGKTLFVTGAAGGVGTAVCDAFAQAGVARIAAVGRTLESLEALQADIESRYPNTTVVPHVADMTDHVAIAAALRRTGKIDILVNVAVFVHDVAPTSNINYEQLVKCFETNTFGPFAMVKSILAEREFKGYTNDLKVIYISGALAHTSLRRLTGYAASKAAFNHFVKDLSAQWKDRGVQFFSCHPGLFFTEIMKKLWLEHEIAWDDVKLPGAYCVWLCSPEAKFLSGKMTWAQWDVDELVAKKEWVEKEAYHLEIGVNMPPDAEDNKDPWEVEA